MLVNVEICDNYINGIIATLYYPARWVRIDRQQYDGYALSLSTR